MYFWLYSSICFIAHQIPPIPWPIYNCFAQANNPRWFYISGPLPYIMGCPNLICDSQGCLNSPVPGIWEFLLAASIDSNNQTIGSMNYPPANLVDLRHGKRHHWLDAQSSALKCYQDLAAVPMQRHHKKPFNCVHVADMQSSRGIC